MSADDADNADDDEVWIWARIDRAVAILHARKLFLIKHHFEEPDRLHRYMIEKRSSNPYYLDFPICKPRLRAQPKTQLSCKSGHNESAFRGEDVCIMTSRIHCQLTQ